MQRATLLLLALAASAALLAAPAAALDDPCLTLEDGAPCQTDVCSVGGTCSAGTCSGESPKDCSAEGDGLCLVGTCDVATGACVATNAADNHPCQTDVCSVGGTCSAGTCSGENPKDCSAEGDGLCLVGTCDADTGACVATNAADNTPCQTDVCSVGGTCSAGTCSGESAKDCSAEGGGLCLVGTCDADTGACVATNAADNTPCQTDVCSVGGTCSAGTCSGESAKDCSAEGDGLCLVGTCDVDTGACVATNAADNTPCQTDVCSVGGTCSAGTCSGESAKDCSAEGDGLCLVGTCDVDTGACVATNAADNTPCQTDVCSVGGTCSAGTCSGESAKDCSAEGDGLCLVGTCDVDTGACVATNAADDTPCQTDVCSVGGTCSAGTCSGESAKDCSAEGDGLCLVGTCDADTGACVATNAAEGTACDDGNACTLADTCDAEGTCQPGTAKTCDEADECNAGTCDPDTGACAYKPLSGQPCNLDESVCTFDTCAAADAAGRSACEPAGAALTLVPAPREETTFKAKVACASEARIEAQKLVAESLSPDSFAEVSGIVYSLNASAPYPMGTTPVLVTGAVQVTRAGLSGTCSSETAVSVVVKDDIEGGDHIRCGFADKSSNAVVMIPKGATTWSGSFTGYYLADDGVPKGVTKAGCPVSASITKSSVSCKTCEGTSDKTCPATATTTTSGATVSIKGAAAGHRISWTVQVVAKDGTVKSRKCGVCVAAYTTKPPAKCPVEWAVDKTVKCGKKSLRRLF
ncbi:hypothetical protein Rsub_05915 [Raphidocelis subcapitata]|uniref:Disintegrin domain-containing protein n=1 Tax=Raphidocelis subcapitata TaxID=307507 RepID=A0A2V0P5P0_9CHLO|nr:hypothetical protein Rsub_05915 [Raphidocelis subcapitata]|eukprot:GBF93183.1 hypothetical protein Rsub_05915 [Raphidocelis subcapitata]